MNWKRILGWTLASLAALIVIGAVGGYFYLRSSGFQEFALRRIITQVDQSTGGRTPIRALDFNLSTPPPPPYYIVIPGKEKSAAPPPFQIYTLPRGLMR